MLLVAMVCVVLMGMVHLFTVTWASQNAHIRAREAVLHGAAYTAGVRADAEYTQPDSSPFDEVELNYATAESTLAPVTFSATASDTSRDDSFGANAIEVKATIVLP
jgi:hypothetical protein